jgi:hypothetical protein
MSQKYEQLSRRFNSKCSVKDILPKQSVILQHIMAKSSAIVVYPISWRFCAIKRVAVGLRSTISRWAFSHNLSLHLTSSIQVRSDGLNLSDNMAHISEKWLVKPRGFFSHIICRIYKARRLADQ